MHPSANSSQDAVDAFDLVHLAVGGVAGYFGMPLIGFIAIHQLFELWENSTTGIRYFNRKDTYLQSLSPIKWPKYQGDSAQNTAMDTLSAAIGWYLGFKLASKFLTRT